MWIPFLFLEHCKFHPSFQPVSVVSIDPWIRRRRICHVNRVGRRLQKRISSILSNSALHHPQIKMSKYTNHVGEDMSRWNPSSVACRIGWVGGWRGCIPAIKSIIWPQMCVKKNFLDFLALFQNWIPTNLISFTLNKQQIDKVISNFLSVA